MPAPLSNRRLLRPLYAVALLTVGVWAYWPTLGRVVAVWSSNPDYSHGFLVPFLCLALLWTRRAEAPTEIGSSLHPAGLTALGAAFLVRAAAGRFYLPELEALSIPLWLAGVTWLLAGRQVLRWAAPALVLLMFAAPLPASVETLMGGVLRTASAEMSASLLRAFGSPAVAEGSIVLVGDQALDVERACSGFRMFYGVLALAVATSTLMRASLWQTSLLVLAAFPISLAGNALRIVLTGVSQRYVSGEVATQLAHDYAALFVLPLAAVALGLLLTTLRAFSQAFELPQARRWTYLTASAASGAAVIGGLMFAASYGQSLALQRLLSESDSLLAAGDMSGSVERLRRYTVLRPDDTAALVALGDRVTAQSPTPEGRQSAFRFYYRAWRQTKSDVDLALKTANAAYQLRRYNAAAEVSDSILQANPTADQRTAATLLRADALLGASDAAIPREAVQALRAAVAVDPPRTRHVVTLASFLAGQASPGADDPSMREASALIDRLVERRPEDPAAWLGRARFRRTWGTLAGDSTAEVDEQADRDLDQALTLNRSRSGAGAAGIYRAAAELRSPDAMAYRELLRRAIESEPSDYRAYLLLAASLSKQRDEPESKLEAIAVLEAGMKFVEGLELSLAIRLASLYAQTNQLSDAQGLLDRIDRALPIISPAQRGQVRLAAELVRARIDQVAGGVQDAAARLQETMRSGPGGAANAEVWKQANERLGVLTAATGWHDQAVQALLTAAAIGPLELESRRVLANSAALNGDLQLAESTYQALLVDQPGDLATEAALLEIAVRRRARIAANSARSLDGSIGGWRDLTRRLERLEQTGLPTSDAAMLRARMLEAQGDPAAGVQVLRDGLRESPQATRLLRSLAILLERSGDQAGAYEAAERFAAAYQEPEATFFLARLLIQQGEFDRAAAKLQSFLADAPGSAEADARLLLAEVELRRAGPEAALGQLTRAAEIDPPRLRILQAMAQLAAAESDWPRLQQAESRLFEFEGDSGTFWRLYAARRLLATTTDLDDPRFREAAQVADQLIRLRPRWGEAHFLQAEVARRLGNQAIATESYVEAWRRGKRDITNADRVLEGLVLQGRLAEASLFMGEIRGLLANAPRLLDRVSGLPLDAVSAGRLVELAEAWVARRPESPEARLRLARALLLVAANDAEATQAERARNRAEAALRTAVRLTPDEASVLTMATHLLMLASAEDLTVEDAISSLGTPSSLDGPQRALVHARVYEQRGDRRQAGAWYNDALREVRSRATQGRPARAADASTVASAAAFVLADSPSLAERYASEAVTLDAANTSARITLARARLQLGANLDDALAALRGVEPAIDPRPMKLAWLRTGGSAEDAEAAIDMIENRLDVSHDDRLLLARLYEQAGRVSTSLRLLESLLDRGGVRSVDHEAFLGFWQRQSLEADDPAFDRRATSAYQFLSGDPARLDAWLRWKHREAQRRSESGEVSAEAAARLVDQAMSYAGEDGVAVYSRQLRTLLDEGAVEGAVVSAAAPPNGVSNADALIALASTLTQKAGTEGQASYGQLDLEPLLRRCADRADAWRAVGDLRLIEGAYRSACDYYEQAASRDSTNAAIRNNLAIAWALRDRGRVAALAAWEEARNLGSPDDEVADTRAWIELCTGDPSIALDALRSIDPSILRVNPAYRLHLAMALSESGAHDAAALVRDEAIVLGVERMPLLPAEREALDRLKREASVTRAAMPAVAAILQSIPIEPTGQR